MGIELDGKADQGLKRGRGRERKLELGFSVGTTQSIPNMGKSTVGSCHLHDGKMAFVSGKRV